MVAPDGIEHVARFLADNPAGVMGGKEGVVNFDFRDLINKCEVFHEMTGEIGDVSSGLYPERTTARAEEDIYVCCRSSSSTRSCSIRLRTIIPGSPG